MQAKGWSTINTQVYIRNTKFECLFQNYLYIHLHNLTFRTESKEVTSRGAETLTPAVQNTLGDLPQEPAFITKSLQRIYRQLDTRFRHIPGFGQTIN